MEDPTLNAYIESLRSGKSVALTDEQLASLAASYPFFVLPFATTAAAERNAPRPEVLERVALVAAERDMLFRLTDPDGMKFANFYPDETPATPDTDSAIDTFLNTYGHRDAREDALLERLIFNPVGDYSAMLEKEAAAATDAAPDSQDALLDAFLSERMPERRQPVTPASPAIAAGKPKESTATPAADSSLNESLAKIYILRGRYDKAYEIIHQLSLNFPKKSIYFADQLRFLKKLIRNQQLLNTRK